MFLKSEAGYLPENLYPLLKKKAGSIFNMSLQKYKNLGFHNYKMKVSLLST
jgi:hypothetical protein